MLTVNEAIQQGKTIQYFIDNCEDEFVTKIGKPEFHKLCFPNKHFNTTVQKLKCIQDELEEQGIIFVKQCKVYDKVIILKPIEAYKAVKEVKLSFEMIQK